MEARRLATQNLLRLLIATKGSCWKILIGNRKKGKILQMIERSEDSLKICKIRRICMEDHWSVTGRQSVFFPRNPSTF